MNFFVQSGDIKEEYCGLSIKDLHYLKQVRRLQFSDTLTLIIDEKEYVKVSNLKFDTKGFFFKPLSQRKPCDVSRPSIALLQGLPKQEKFEEIIQSCTQIGVDQFIPIVMERTIIKWDQNKKEEKKRRWENIAESAASQSQRMMIPDIWPIQSFKECLQAFPFYQFDLLIVPWEEESTLCLSQYVKVFFNPERVYKIAILIGPEGGISKGEIESLKKEGFVGVSLGRTILRTENAGFFTVAQLIMAGQLLCKERSNGDIK